jgi:hypothetical protein
MFKKKVNAKKPFVIPDIPSGVLATLKVKHSTCKELAITNEDLQNSIEGNKLEIKRQTQEINRLAFEAVVEAGLDAKAFIVDLDTMKFKNRYHNG